MNDNNTISLEIVTGKQKKNPSQEWTALKVTIGEWTKLVFVNDKNPLIRSNFELDYIEKVIEKSGK